MSFVKVTLELYGECARDTWRALPRSAWAVAGLFLATPVLLVAGVLTTPLGMVGGFIMGFLHAAVVGWYLALVEIGVVGRRRCRLDDLTGNIGTYLWEVISVLFIFWIAGMLLMGSPQVRWVAVLVATLVFNPVPEMIYQSRTRSLALLGDAAKFMQHNWPEWLIAHLVAAGFLAGWGWLVAGRSLAIPFAVDLIQMFGPWFGFISAGTLSLQSATIGVTGVVAAVGILLFVHAFLLFRGFLYRNLGRSSRRARAWRAKLR